MATSEVTLKTAKEFRGLDTSALKESAEEIRRLLASMKVQLAADQKINAGIKRKSKKNLAKILTVIGESKKVASSATIVAGKVKPKSIAKVKKTKAKTTK